MENRRFHYGWAVVLACFFCCFSYGIFYSFGVFFKHLQQAFGWSRGLTSTIHSLHWIFYPVSSLLIGWITDKYGPKTSLIAGGVLISSGIILLSFVQSPIQFYVFYAIASMGSGISWSLPMGTVQHWFTKKRGLALGMTISGVGFGYSLSPIASILISHFGWRSAYLILGTAMGFILAFAGCIICRSPVEKGLKPYGAETMQNETPKSNPADWKPEDAVKTTSFWKLCSMFVCHVFAVMIVAVHLVNFATDIGIDEVHAATSWFAIGCFSIIGRILGGYLGEKMGYQRAFILFGLSNAVVVLWLLAVKNLWMIMLFVPFYGFCYGGQTPIIPALMGRFYGLKPLSTLLGFQFFTAILGGVTAPWFAGFLFDKFQNYHSAFVAASCFWALTALLAYLLKTPRIEVLRCSA